LIKYFGGTKSLYGPNGSYTEADFTSQSMADVANEIRESNRLKRLELMFLMSGKRMSVKLLEQVSKDGITESVEERLKWR
jgi:hypothetical protein